LLFKPSDFVVEKIVQHANETAREKMAKKLILPVFYVAEWAFFLYIFLVILLFNLLNYVTLLLVDMPGEERIPLTSSAGTSFFLNTGNGIDLFHLYEISSRSLGVSKN
jgi:hypothetical protein